MKWLFPISLLVLCGCTVTVPPGTTDQSKLSPATTQSAINVALLESPPAGGKSLGRVTETSCQRFQWEPVPTEDTVLILLKAKAGAMGATGLTDVSYRHHNISVTGNCFGNIVATGIAWK